MISKVIKMDMIKTQRLLLRPVKWKDLADYNEYASIPQIGYLSGWRPHASKLDTLAAIKNLKEAPGHYAIEFENKMIGTASIQPDDKRPGLKALMLGYSVNPDYHNKGIATETAKALIKKAFSMNYDCVAGYCYPENEASKKVLLKCGLSYEGTLKMSYKLYNGEVKDVECYLITREEYEN